MTTFNSSVLAYCELWGGWCSAVHLRAQVWWPFLSSVPHGLTLSLAASLMCYIRVCIPTICKVCLYILPDSKSYPQPLVLCSEHSKHSLTMGWVFSETILFLKVLLTIWNYHHSVEPTVITSCIPWFLANFPHGFTLLCAPKRLINLQYFKSRFWENPNLEDAPFWVFRCSCFVFFFLELYSEV